VQWHPIVRRVFHRERLCSAYNCLWRRPSASIPGAERFECDTKGRRAFSLGEAESSPDFSQDRGAFRHRSRQCHRSAAERKRMDGDENPRLVALQNGRKTAKSISVGRFRPVALSGAIVGELSRTHSATRKIWPVWRARQDSNLRPPA
jgi:hypothetical protein